MPIHDWTRVVAGTYHDFHQSWITHIKEALNGGLLPGDYYAMAEQRAGGPEPDVLALSQGTDTGSDDFQDSHSGGGGGVATAAETLLAVAEHPPRVEVVEHGEDAEIYARKADRIAIYHANGDRVVAFIEIVSPGNKKAESKVRSFVETLSDLFNRGCHLLLIDVIPTSSFDPRGLHAEIWGYLKGSSHGLDPERPLGVSSYQAADSPMAYFQPLRLGEPLPEMPLFLTPKYYVNVPLEATYQAAWRGVPRQWKQVLDGGSPS